MSVRPGGLVCVVGGRGSPGQTRPSLEEFLQRLREAAGPAHGASHGTQPASGRRGREGLPRAALSRGQLEVLAACVADAERGGVCNSRRLHLSGARNARQRLHDRLASLARRGLLERVGLGLYSPTRAARDLVRGSSKTERQAPGAQVSPRPNSVESRGSGRRGRGRRPLALARALFFIVNYRKGEWKVSDLAHYLGVSSKAAYNIARRLVGMGVTRPQGRKGWYVSDLEAAIRVQEAISARLGACRSVESAWENCRRPRGGEALGVGSLEVTIVVDDPRGYDSGGAWWARGGLYRYGREPVQIKYGEVGVQFTPRDPVVDAIVNDYVLRAYRSREKDGPLRAHVEFQPRGGAPPLQACELPRALWHLSKVFETMAVDVAVDAHVEYGCPVPDELLPYLPAAMDSTPGSRRGRAAASLAELPKVVGREG